MDRNLQELVANLPDCWQELLLKQPKLLYKIEDQLVEKANELLPLTIYPSPENTFRAFTFNKLTDIKVVIIGQDCYHGPGQATGLCFGVNNNIKCPPSLLNIKRELKNDIGVELQDQSLVNWASQGVLLLNSALTVHQALAGSHLKIWNSYTDNLIKQFSDKSEKVVFLLWGNYAKSKEKIINSKNSHYILTANHPSPLSANRGGWFSTKHFSKTNKYLIEIGKSPIDWS